jgi:hypothetical protein
MQLKKQARRIRKVLVQKLLAEGKERDVFANMTSEEIKNYKERK